MKLRSSIIIYCVVREAWHGMDVQRHTFFGLTLFSTQFFFSKITSKGEFCQYKRGLVVQWPYVVVFYWKLESNWKKMRGMISKEEIELAFWHPFILRHNFYSGRSFVGKKRLFYREKNCCNVRWTLLILSWVETSRVMFQWFDRWWKR
jgi:hypothetical protein